MANNRLYIVSTRTGARLYLARSNAPIGWRMVCSRAEFDEWMKGRDLEAVEGAEDTTLMLITDVAICAETSDGE